MIFDRIFSILSLPVIKYTEKSSKKIAFNLIMF